MEAKRSIPAEMTIRPYQASDYSGCIRAFEGNHPEFFADHEKAEFQELLNGLSESNKEEPVCYYVVEIENQIAACAGFYFPDNQPATAGLVWGMVAREFHRKGIGKQLLTFRLNKIQELRPGASVILDTTQLSFPFFEKLGFRITQITKDFYAPGLDRYDMILAPPVVPV
ncbi:N-acetylglutamate synthase-like GNAT family acetyltransferase [Dyadobacter sp. BE34]|uniref:N-acetylglutamate synthase-like GNAT family acetyltransferase n=1 Tax=Dyadobacter fermentans TaxID=94254 RepID=A0ABU1QVD1_9BACT|nr:MULTISPECIES: GNAT family N-acetyltransferase [Dyadobacter]MDR6804932.1 N-acetylglutamate synthase-like GNAT family acetyltransferase [Dyadobacter fermentans]MDR7043309.1 N-acetylglutamate synthase-like GNAT family acetyltransferase [Dyadobacter sp. BE242]MDR7197621.1 N-acetylglutamate synthase-like GNAT family acetyltransferase [Dyadobacter sp. BE34]MDR7214946.1 N-acetylglutamate synthase-like GNAT family acetyltransferase [Dyadobacter sp. BE31]MDR7262481.1 N-acetylglutamate synthase-like 